MLLICSIRGLTRTLNALPCLIFDYSDEELEFMKAMDHYKKENHRPFPTWSEVFKVFTEVLGYKKG